MTAKELQELWERARTLRAEDFWNALDRVLVAQSMTSRIKNERRGGGERRSGADRRKDLPLLSRSRSAPAVAGVAGTLASYVAALLSQKYGVPIEVSAPIVGAVFAALTGIYNKVVLPWMK